MFGFMASNLAVLLGGLLQVCGVVLLLYGLDKTRASISEDWDGLPAEARRWVGRRYKRARKATRALWRRLRRRPEPVSISLGPVELGVTANIVGVVSVPDPLWKSDTVTPEEVRDLLARVRDRHEAALNRLRDETTTWQASEVEARATGDRKVLAEVHHVAAGGLRFEMVGGLLIVAGLVVSTWAAIAS